jgi:hypothetical protein
VTAHREDPVDLAPDDDRLIETLRSQLDPGERTPAQRAAFQARLEERLERSSSPSWRPLGLATCAALAAAALWLALPAGLLGGLLGGAEGSGVRSASAAEPGLLVYAYYETDYLAAASEGESGFLSDEYRAIATAFEVP